MKSLVLMALTFLPAFGQYIHFTFNPLHPNTNIHATAKDYFIKIDKVMQCHTCPNGMQINLTIQNRHTGQIRFFILRNMTAQIAAMHVYQNRYLTIFGNITQDISIITIINLHSLLIRDQFQCLWPSISPNHQWIIFRMWFPVRIPAKYVINDQYLIYNVNQNAYYNRPHQAFINQFNAGIIVYPNIFSRAHELSDIISKSMDHHSITSNGFYWLSSRNVVFADQYARTTNLIKVHVNGNISKIKITKLCISCYNVINQKKCGNYSINTFRINDIYKSAHHLKSIWVIFQTWNPHCLRIYKLKLKWQY